MIALNHLQYYYKGSSFAAISEVDTRLDQGIHLLLGENGAGKTTLLHLIAGLLRPTEGSVEVDGSNPWERHPSTMRRIFFMGDEVKVPTSTIREFAGISSVFYPTFDAKRFEMLLSRFGLTGNEKFESQSLGNRKKAFLCFALALSMPVLLLDEPANGLDITSKQILQQLFAECISPEQTVIVSTHNPSDFAWLYDGVIMINRSKLVTATPTWHISERLAFGANLLPPAAPIYMEQRTGLFHYVTAADPENPTNVDFTLLYNALLSPSASQIIQLLSTDNNDTDE